jgi:hypothetical protein
MQPLTVAPENGRRLIFFGGQNMSDVKGNVSLGKGKKKVTVHIKGQATRAQWAELKQKLASAVRHYGLSINVPKRKKKSKPKKAKPK